MLYLPTVCLFRRATSTYNSDLSGEVKDDSDPTILYRPGVQRQKHVTAILTLGSYAFLPLDGSTIARETDGD